MTSTLKGAEISLRDLLAGAPRCSREVLADMAALGFSAKQVRNAREKLRLVTARTGSGSTMRTTWALPPAEAIRAHADGRCTPAPARDDDEKGTHVVQTLGGQHAPAQATVPTGPAVRSAAVRSQVRSGEGVKPAPTCDEDTADAGRMLGNAQVSTAQVSTVVSAAGAALAPAHGALGAEGAAPTKADMAPAADSPPTVATVPPQAVDASVDLPRGPGFGDSLKRGQRLDLMDEAELRAYARTIGISQRDCDGLTVARLRQNCTAQLYELIDAL